MDLENIEDTEMLLGDDTEEFAPPALMVSAPAMDIGFHPHLPIFAAGLVTGEVEVYEYHGNEIIKKSLVNDFSSWVFGRDKMYSEEDVLVSHHNNNMRMHPTGAVAAMEFTDDGNYLVTASSDRTISVMDCVSARLMIHIAADEVRKGTDKAKKINAINKKNPDGVKLTKKAGKTYTVTPNPHKYGISALNVCDENLVATGDDDGVVAIWDMRERKPVQTYHEHGDYVSQLCYFTDAHELVSSSGDTCLGCYDVRAGKIRDFSNRRKDEINCFAFVNSTAPNNRSFIPSIVCGTPSGSLPIWKYGSWARPYDVMDYHPKECEAIIAFHGENTVFNHNMILTGACDGLVRVIQMYPVRRNICQISARDYTYSHQNASLGTGSSTGNFVVRKGRGHELITKMRVSHDCNLLAVSGSDNIIDFVDIRVLNDEDALDKLRGKAELRHMSTLRKMELEAEDRLEEDQRRLLEEQAMFKEMERAPKSGAAAVAAAKKVAEAAPATASSDKDEDEDDADDEGGTRSDSGESSGSEPTEEDRHKSVAMKDKLLALLRARAATKKRDRAERDRLAMIAAEDRESDEDAYHAGEYKPGGDTDSGFDSSDDADMFSSDDERVIKHKKKKLKAKRALEAQKQLVAATAEPDAAASPVKKAKGEKKEKKAKRDKTAVAAADKKPLEPSEEHQKDAEGIMDAFAATRQEKRDRAAAARWLKDQKRKKINFTYEKRRRRVGGFFGDMVQREAE